MTTYVSRITGRDIDELHKRYAAFDLQHMIGLYLSKIQEYCKEGESETNVDDVTRCFVIRTLQQHPELVPGYKYSYYKDLVAVLDSLDEGFILPKNESLAGVWFGRSFSTAYSIKRGREESQQIRIWLTMLLSHMDEIKSQGAAHPLVKVMEQEALARSTTLQEVIDHKGWPSESETAVSNSLFPRITGEHLVQLNEQMSTIDFQAITGLYPARCYQLKHPRNINNVLKDTTQCLIVRTLLQYPDMAPLPEFRHVPELYEALQKLPANDVFPDIFPTMKSKMGIVIGRSASITSPLVSGKREEMRILTIWATILMENLDSIIETGPSHPLVQVILDEAKSRNLTLDQLLEKRGWPSS
ncbi:hypothetical protein [Marinobacterium stanieri]|uniref:Uncharacterized protein n=1 Tax=Marinobacterium stanieri TaxID=49186 RepID=A0A1N6X9N1_9GAMM|nr:hypothetical protein [Marinobacterium stanieri]SIQ99055.1 hypothetical protein SAMN05421647_11335 [Marinobacterium stanieri]